MNVELWGGLSEASGGGVEDEEREEEEEEEEEEEGMRCCGGAAESSKMLTQQTGRGDRWLRGAGGDPPALPPSREAPPGRRGGALPPAHAEGDALPRLHTPRRRD